MDIMIDHRPESDETKFVSGGLYLESALLILLFIAGLLANVPVLILYFRSKHIRSITDKFLLNLLLADIVSVVVLFPIVLSSFVQISLSSETREDSLVSSPFFLEANSRQISVNITIGDDVEHNEGNQIEGNYWQWNCALSNGILAGLATASVLAALVIAMERYLAVVKPLHYHKLLTTPSILVTSLIGGTISIATAIIATVEPNCSFFPYCLQQQLQVQRQSHVRLQKDAEGNGILEGLNIHPSGTELNLNSGGESHSDIFIDRPSPNLTNGLIWSLYSLASGMLLFVIPIILMLYIYSKIWMEARRQRIKMANQYKPYFLPIPSDHVVSNESEKKKHGTFLPIMVKFRLMNRLRATRLDRAGRVAVIALVVTILCWSPYYFVKASRAIKILLTIYGYESQTPRVSSPPSTWFSTVLPLLLAALHPLLSPLFYAYRYKRLRTEIFKWISSLCIPSSENNRWDGKTSGGGFTNSTMHTNNSSISGGTPCIRQAIITQNQVSSPPPPPQSKEAVVLSGHQFEQIPPPPRVGVDGDIRIEEQQVNLILDEDGNDFSVPREKIGGDQSDQDRSYIFKTPTSNICINVFSSEDEEYDGDNQRGDRALGVRSDDARIGVDEDQSPQHFNAGGSGSSNAFVGGIVRSTGNFFNYLNVWVNSYSRRWLSHRESVTSTASFITLLSSKYHNKTHTVASV